MMMNMMIMMTMVKTKMKAMTTATMKQSTICVWRRRPQMKVTMMMVMIPMICLSNGSQFNSQNDDACEAFNFVDRLCDGFCAI
jgi:hypothetical protein